MLAYPCGRGGYHIWCGTEILESAMLDLLGEAVTLPVVAVPCKNVVMIGLVIFKL